MNTVLSRSNPQPTTRLHIQNVVLDGIPFGTVDAGTLQVGLVQELSCLLTLSSSSDWSSCAAARLYTPPVALGMGPFEQIIQALDPDGMARTLMGQISYQGQWSYDPASKVLILRFAAQVGMFGGGADTWQMQLTGMTRGVYQAVDAGMDNYEIKRIG